MAFTVFIYGVRWCVTILYRSTVAVEWLAKPSPLKQYGVLPHFLMDKVYFWPSNSCLGLILAIELQNRISSTTQLSKPFTFGHPTVLVAGFADVDATWQ